MPYAGGMSWDQDGRRIQDPWTPEGEEELAFSWEIEDGLLVQANSLEELANVMGLAPEAIETFLLYQQEDGDEFLSSEEVREACNATYRAAAKGLRRRGRLVLILTAAAELLLLLSRTYLEAGLWVLIPFFLFPVLAWAVLGILKKRTLDRLWVCPQCGKSLPVSEEHFSPKPIYATQCPHCGHPLEDPATLETEGEEEDPLEGLPLPQPASKWPSRVYGSLTLAYCLLTLSGALAGLGEATGLGVALALLLHVPVLALGLALLLCNGPELPEFPQPQLAVRESWIPLVLGLCLLPLGLAFMIPALGGLLDPVLDLPFALFLALVGLLLVLTGAWALLARRNPDPVTPFGTAPCSTSPAGAAAGRSPRGRPSLCGWGPTAPWPFWTRRAKSCCRWREIWRALCCWRFGRRNRASAKN